MAGDPFGLLLRQRIVFLGGEVRLIRLLLFELLAFTKVFVFSFSPIRRLNDPFAGK
jgi:hypothetical protein